MNQPYVFGQSGTERPEPVLVTMPPAAMSSTRAADDELDVAVQPDHASGLARLEREGDSPSVSLAPIVTLCVCVPSFSCHASMV